MKVLQNLPRFPLQIPLLSSMIGFLLASAMGCAVNDAGRGKDATSDKAGEIVVYAHMANTTAAVEWALSVGANTVEMDLQFQSDGTPQEFRRFTGQVVIGTPSMDQIDYTEAAIKAANKSINQAKYYFTIDNERDDFLAVAKALVHLTTNRGFSTGITACLPETYYEAIELSALNEKDGVMSFAAIWSLNDEFSMSTYLDDGANGLMTNIPSHALAALKAKGLTLAKPGTAFAPSTSTKIITHLPDS